MNYTYSINPLSQATIKPIPKEWKKLNKILVSYFPNCFSNLSPNSVVSLQDSLFGDQELINLSVDPTSTNEITNVITFNNKYRKNDSIFPVPRLITSGNMTVMISKPIRVEYILSMT